MAGTVLLENVGFKWTLFGMGCSLILGVGVHARKENISL